MAKLKRRTKSCKGCDDHFITLKNYDYCKDCAINNNRYATKSPCSECDGSGIIKFRNQKPRSCKLCYLTKNPMKDKNYNLLNKKLEKYWDQVDLLAQEKVYQLLTQKVPFQNIKLITEPYLYEDKQDKLTGLFLHKDADYRSVLSDTERYYSEGPLPDKETVAEEVVFWYTQVVIKSLIKDLSNYPIYDPSYFEF